MQDAKIARMIDKQEITEVIYRLARGLDRCDEALLRRCYHPDATFDQGIFKGNAPEFFPWVLKTLGDMTSSMHSIANILIDFKTADAATTESYFTAYHRITGQVGEPLDMTIAGRYLDRLSRRGGEWRVSHRGSVFDWIITQPATDTAWHEPPMVELLARGQRGQADLSYMFSEDVEAINSKREFATQDAKISNLIDKQEITEVIYRLSRGLDRCDEALLRSCYHEDATDDHGIFKGGVSDFFPWVLEVLHGMVGTMHSIANILVTLHAPDAAKAESYFTAYHRLSGPDGAPLDMIAGGRYLDKFIRRAGQWRIIHRGAVYDWCITQPAADASWRESPMRELLARGQRGRADLSYAE